MNERRPLIDRIIASTYGKNASNSSEFAPGTKVGPHSCVRRVGSMDGCSYWLLTCPHGHELRRKAYEIRQVIRKKRGDFLCQECIAAGLEKPSFGRPNRTPELPVDS